MLRKIFRKLVYALVGKREYTDEEYCQRLIDSIRAGGGHVGQNVDILHSHIDMGEPYLLSIGDNVTITGVEILTHDASTKKILGYTKIGRVSIGSDCFIGVGCIILPDTKIGNKVIVGAGSVIAKDIPDNSVVVGNPARIICSFDEYIERMKQKMLSGPCLDLLPEEIMSAENAEYKKMLIKAGNGFIL